MITAITLWLPASLLIGWLVGRVIHVGAEDVQIEREVH